MLLNLTSRVSRPALAGLLLAAFHAAAQAPAADTTRPRPLAPNLLGMSVGFGLSLVNADDDYYLPNDGAKFGSEVGFTYTHFFGSRPSSPIGLRTGLGLVGRTGTYQFFGPYQGRQVKRGESFLTVPLELVTRRRWSSTSRWYSSVALGGYFSQLLTRYTYTLDPTSGKTQRTSDNWVYATGGVSLDYAFGYQANARRYRQLGLRISSDLFHPKEPDAGQLPNLRQGNITLYYTTSVGF